MNNNIGCWTDFAAVLHFKFFIYKITTPLLLELFYTQQTSVNLTKQKKKLRTHCQNRVLFILHGSGFLFRYD